jgi:ABC-2 type transport system permease protein
MISTLTVLTLRQLLGKGRVILLLFFAALPLLVATVFAIVDPDDVDHLRWTARALESTMVVALLLPLTALILGTAAFGNEIEDGTAVYLLATPVSRLTVFTAKFLATWVTTVVLCCVVAAAGGLIAGGREPGAARLVLSFEIAIVVSAAAYCAVFVTLGIVASRAFIIGLAYVFIWENLITRLFTGTRILSIRQFALAIAEGLADVSTAVLDARLGALTGWVMVVIVCALAGYVGVRRLRGFELGESG